MTSKTHVTCERTTEGPMSYIILLTSKEAMFTYCLCLLVHRV